MTADALGSPQYAAPELNTDSHTNKVDVFSYAIILWEVCNRAQPWSDLKFGWQFAEKYSKGERPDPPNHPLRNLVTKCWSHNPAERPSFSQIYEELEQLKSIYVNNQNLHQSAPTIMMNTQRTPPPSVHRTTSQTSYPNGQAPVQSFYESNTPTSAPPRRPPPSPMSSTSRSPTMSQPQVESFYVDVGSNSNGVSPASSSSSPSMSGPTSPASGGYLSHAEIRAIANRPTPPASRPASTMSTPSNNNPAYMNPAQVRQIALANPGQGRTPPPVPANTSVTKSPPNPGLPSEKKPVNSIEEKFLKAFAERPKETWPNLSNIFKTTMNATPRHLSAIKYLFDDGGYVDRAIYNHFLLWFSPLCAERNYVGFDIDTITEIVEPSWFHGFLSASDAQARLKGFAEGTFLFRFSTTTPGYYSLSVSYGGIVGHWRISTIKEIGRPPRFGFDEREFNSLGEIIQTYSKVGGGEPLKIKNPRPEGPSVAYLTDPYHRAEQYYQNIH